MKMKISPRLSSSNAYHQTPLLLLGTQFAAVLALLIDNAIILISRFLQRVKPPRSQTITTATTMNMITTTTSLPHSPPAALENGSATSGGGGGRGGGGSCGGGRSVFPLWLEKPLLLLVALLIGCGGGGIGVVLLGVLPVLMRGSSKGISWKVRGGDGVAVGVLETGGEL